MASGDENGVMAWLNRVKVSNKKSRETITSEAAGKASAAEAIQTGSKHSRTSAASSSSASSSSARPRTGSEGPMKAPTHHLPGAGMLVGFERHHRRAPYKRFLVGFKSHTKQ